MFLVLPLAVFFWVFGWSLHWIGATKKMTIVRKKDSSKQLTFTVLMPEQKYAR